MNDQTNGSSRMVTFLVAALLVALAIGLVIAIGLGWVPVPSVY